MGFNSAFKGLRTVTRFKTISAANDLQHGRTETVRREWLGVARSKTAKQGSLPGIFRGQVKVSP